MGHKDFEKGGQTGTKGACLKKGGGLEPPYQLWVVATDQMPGHT